MSSCIFPACSSKPENKGRKGRQTRRSLTKLQGGEAIIHQHPHLLKSSQLPAPFKMRVMGALGRSLPRCLATGFRPPPVEPPTSSRCHSNTSSSSVTCTGGGGGGGQGGEGLAVWVPSGAATENREKIWLCVCVCEVGWGIEGVERQRGWWEVCEKDLRQTESSASFTMCWCDADANGQHRDSCQWKRKERKQTEDRNAPLKEVQLSFQCFLSPFSFHYCLIPSPPCRSIHVQIHTGIKAGAALLKGIFKVVAVGGWVHVNGQDFPARIQLVFMSKTVKLHQLLPVVGHWYIIYQNIIIITTL